MKSELRTSLAMLLFAAALYFASAAPSNQAAFVFPKMIALILVGIAAASIWHGWTRGGADKSSTRVRIPWRAIWPALIVFALSVTLAEQLGFYVTCLIAFISLVALYSSPGRWMTGVAKICVIAAAFIGVLYVLFTLVLRVQIPQGMLM